MGMGIAWGFVSIATGLLIDWKVIFEIHGMLMISTIIYFLFIYYLNGKRINNKLFLFLHTMGIILLIYGAHQGAVLCGLHF